MSALDDARHAVQRSDERRATAGETRALRDALRALIQHVDELGHRVEYLEDRAEADDSRN